MEFAQPPPGLRSSHQQQAGPLFRAASQAVSSAYKLVVPKGIRKLISVALPRRGQKRAARQRIVLPPAKKARVGLFDRHLSAQEIEEIHQARSIFARQEGQAYGPRDSIQHIAQASQQPQYRLFRQQRRQATYKRSSYNSKLSKMPYPGYSQYSKRRKVVRVTTTAKWIKTPLRIYSSMTPLPLRFTKWRIAKQRSYIRVMEQMEQQGFVHASSRMFVGGYNTSATSKIDSWGTALGRKDSEYDNPTRGGFSGGTSLIVQPTLNQCRWCLLHAFSFAEINDLYQTCTKGSWTGLPTGVSGNENLPFAGTSWFGHDLGTQDVAHTGGLLLKSYRRTWYFENLTDMHQDIDVWQMHLQPDYWDIVQAFQSTNVAVYGYGCSEALLGAGSADHVNTYGDWTHFMSPLAWWKNSYQAGQVSGGMPGEAVTDPMASVARQSPNMYNYMIPRRHWHTRLSAGKTAKLSVIVRGKVFHEDDFALGPAKSGTTVTAHTCYNPKMVFFFVKVRGPWAHESGMAPATQALGSMGYAPTVCCISTKLDVVMCPIAPWEGQYPEVITSVPALESASGGSTSLLSTGAIRIMAGQEGRPGAAAAGDAQGIGIRVLGGSVGFSKMT